MVDSPAEPAPSADDDAPDARTSKGWSAGRIAAVVAVLGMVLFWMWILSGAPAKQNPDWISDRTYADALEGRCKALRKDLAALPQPEDTPTPDARADVIEQANAKVADFVDQIDDGAPTTGSSAKGLQGWIADWKTYLADRVDYVERLRKDDGARLYVDKSPLGRPVDETIEIYAQVNRIEDCATPGDIG